MDDDVTRLRFLIASRGDPFLAELVELVADTANDLGVASDVVVDAYPEPEQECVYVTVPHEFFELAPEHGNPQPAQLQRTIAFCVEPPGDVSFHIAAHYASQLGAVLHTHRSGCDELGRIGISSEHFQLGYSTRWDLWQGVDTPRSVDALHIGARDAWRGETVAGWAPTLWRHHCRFVLPQTLSERNPQLDGLLPDGRLQALRSARVLLNLHQRHREHFEWPLTLAAIANGCVVISEHSLDAAPLQSGVHYLSGRAEELGQLTSELLEDEQRLRDMRERAYDLVRDEFPLARSVERLLDLARKLLDRSPGEFWPLSPSQPSPTTERQEESVLDPQMGAIAGSLMRLNRSTLDTRRRLERIEHRMISSEPPDEPLLVYESETFAAARPSVSVIVSLYEYEHEVHECLASVASSEFVDYEVLVLDDASNDGSVFAAQGFLAGRPRIPALILRHPVNQGLARTRNDMVARARGEFVFVLDADNLIFPSALERLVAALKSDPRASFAYPIQVAYREWRFTDVLNAWSWNPRQLVQANYIDAMALIRREVLEEHGGYTEDPRICNCEDHDLWCQLADRGQRGVLVPELLAVYRIQAHSQLRTIGGSENAHTLSLIRSRAPGLMRRLVEEENARA
jgi:GT2 family glycosyltransferase